MIAHRMDRFAALSDTARRFVHLQRDLAFIVPGWAYYLATGTTPVRAYRSMRDLFCVTDGRFNDTVSDVMRLFRPPLALDSTTGVLGDMSGATLERVVRDLDEEGYHVFDRRLPPEVVDEMHAFALRTPCNPHYGKGIEAGPSVLFDERTERSPVLHFDSEILLDCPPVRKLLLDKSILSVAQAYVRQRVVLDTPRMWWSTPGTGTTQLRGRPDVPLRHGPLAVAQLLLSADRRRQRQRPPLLRAPITQAQAGSSSKGWAAIG